MRHCLILSLMFLFSCSSVPEFVYMKEDVNGKSVEVQTNKGKSTPLNNPSDKTWAIYPDISSDGKEVIYVGGMSQNDLRLNSVDLEKNLTQTLDLPQKGMILHPKFSRNGEWIFYSAPGPNGKNVIWYVKNHETEAKMLTDEEAYFPRPSSDGSFVIYQRNTGGKKEIVLFDRIENKKSVLAEGMSPALSFDERRIAYTSRKDGNWNIYVIDRTSGEITQMTSDPKDEMSPTFKTDHSLVFSSNKSGHFQLYHLQGKVWKEVLSGSGDADYYAPQFAGETQIKQSELAPYAGPPRSSFGTVSHQGRIYMSGGHQGAEHTYPPESFSDLFYAYDIATDKWHELTPRPVRAHGYQLAAFENYIYAFGGFTFSPDHKPGWKSLSQIDRYDIKKNKWETVAHLESPRSSNVAVTIKDKVYIAGGWDSTPKKEKDFEGKFHNTIEVFDLRTEKISTAPYKLTSLRRALTGIPHDGKILLIGGLGEGSTHFELLNHVTAIDPETGKSEELTPLPFATFAPAAGILNDELFVFGGMFKTGKFNYEYVAHIYGMKLSEKKWRHTGRYLKETKGFSQVFHLSGKTLGILGGHHYTEGKDTPVTTFETFSN